MKCTGYKLLMLCQKPGKYNLERQREYKKFSYFWPPHCKKFSNL